MREGIPALVTLAALLALAFFLAMASAPVLAQEGIFEQDKLTGDWGGLRKTLKDAGIDLGVNDTSEMLSNPVGGIKQATIYQGLLATTLTLDLEKLANWPGASLYAEGYQISGRGLSRTSVGNLLAISNIEALASTRLVDLWLQQEFLERKASLRIGQIALDDEFYIRACRQLLQGHT